MHIVMVEPEIPGNTGNVARLCAANGFALHLVRPLGFVLDDKHLKRAGLDYWHLVDVVVHDSFADVERAYCGHRFHYFTTKARRAYTDVRYAADDLLVFGKETAGLPATLLADHAEECVRIPMRREARSLNLSNAVAIASYEALRQIGFFDEVYP